ncbi:MAG: peptidase [Pseudomonadota bacterium]|nr:peptidase [Pseudomonadota bacterium]
MTHPTLATQDSGRWVHDLPVSLGDYREMLLANLIMIGEIPAPAFDEAARIEFVKQRFTECGLQKVSSDSAGNGLAVLPGQNGGRSILLTAHTDTPFPDTVAHTLTVSSDRVTGPGVADNSLGLAALTTLPTILEGLGLGFTHDLVFMADTRSLGKGNLEGLRSFLTRADIPILAGLTIEGVQLGRLDYISLATLGGEIACVTDTTNGTANADTIAALNQIITRLRNIPMPGEPLTRLVLGSIAGGTSYKSPAHSATLRFQLRGESDTVVDGIAEEILTICEEVATDLELGVNFDVIARTRAGGLSPGHPLVQNALAVQESLGINTLAPAHSSAASVFLEGGLPSLTVGVSRGENRGGVNEYVDIKPTLKGLAQVIGILRAIDGGCCGED